MFDHVKRAKHWTTMACQTYDSAYCWIMIVAICDMQQDDATNQSILQKNLNAIMARHGVPKTRFKEFMVNSV
jgi:hypothetical protein